MKNIKPGKSLLIKRKLSEKLHRINSNIRKRCEIELILLFLFSALFTGFKFRERMKTAMKDKVTLYHLEHKDIKIDMEIY